MSFLYEERRSASPVRGRDLAHDRRVRRDLSRGGRRVLGHDLHDDAGCRGSRVLLSGPASRPTEVAYETGNRSVGIRFTRGTYFTHVEPTEMRNRTIPLRCPTARASSSPGRRGRSPTSPGRRPARRVRPAWPPRPRSRGRRGAARRGPIESSARSIASLPTRHRPQPPPGRADRAREGGGGTAARGRRDRGGRVRAGLRRPVAPHSRGQAPHRATRRARRSIATNRSDRGATGVVPVQDAARGIRFTRWRAHREEEPPWTSGPTIAISDDELADLQLPPRTHPLAGRARRRLGARGTPVPYAQRLVEYWRTRTTGERRRRG